MKIIVNNHEFETNPAGVNTDLMFIGTVHSGTGIQENVFGFTEEQVIEIAKELKKLNNDFNTVHIYSPVNKSERVYIGIRFLNH